jgi:hypothetical protein
MIRKNDDMAQMVRGKSTVIDLLKRSLDAGRVADGEGAEL